jgi:hypothetical protein
VSTLGRYQKAGGFLQLLNLIETCGPTKREKFLQMIREEDARWAIALEKKMITIEMIWTWPDEILAEVIGGLQDLTVAVILHGVDEQVKNRIYSTFSHTQKRKIEDLAATQKPTVGEISTMLLKVLVEVRAKISDGKLRLEQISHDLIIEDDIEENLRKGAPLSSPTPAPHMHIVSEPIDSHKPLYSPAGDSVAHDVSAEEIASLKKRLATMTHENQTLRHEVHELRSKLEQIRKIA